VLQLSATIPAAPSVVWAALTTAQGWRRLGVQSAAVDYRVGGVIETLYKMFAAGNGYTLETLQKSFAGGGSPP
jgi:hypothetical protein